jgi:hypothetical protein
LELRVHAHKDISLLVQRREEFTRKVMVSQVWDEVATRVRQKAGSLVMENPEQACQQELIPELDACVAKGERAA